MHARGARLKGLPERGSGTERSQNREQSFDVVAVIAMTGADVVCLHFCFIIIDTYMLYLSLSLSLYTHIHIVYIYIYIYIYIHTVYVYI